jgi:hypothetical protein
VNSKFLGNFIQGLDASDRFECDFCLVLAGKAFTILFAHACSFLLQATILNYCPDFGVHYSDLDFLVEFEQPTFDNYMNLAFSLEKLFGRHVDLVTSDGLSNHVRPYIVKEVLRHEA